MTDELSRELKAGHHSRQATLGLFTPCAWVSGELLLVPSDAIQKSLILFHRKSAEMTRKSSRGCPEGCWHCPFGDGWT